MPVEVTCPCCGEPIDLWIDEGGGAGQAYVEDCPVCCRPLAVTVRQDEDGALAATVRRLDD